MICSKESSQVWGELGEEGTRLEMLLLLLYYGSFGNRQIGDLLKGWRQALLNWGVAFDPLFLLVHACSSWLYGGLGIFYREPYFIGFSFLSIPHVYGQVGVVIINEIFYLTKNKNNAVLTTVGRGGSKIWSLWVPSRLLN